MCVRLSANNGARNRLTTDARSLTAGVGGRNHEFSAQDAPLLVQLFLDRFAGGTRAEGTPEAKGAGGTRRQTASSTRSSLDYLSTLAVTCLDRIGDEDHRAVGHQDMATALVATTWRIDALTGDPIPTALLSIRRKDRIET